MSRTATPRQLEVLRFILDATEEHGFAPTFVEIGAALGIRSTNGVSEHVEALVRNRYLEPPVRRARSLRLTAHGRKALGAGYSWRDLARHLAAENARLRATITKLRKGAA